MPYLVVAMAKAFSDPVKIVPARTLVRDKVAMQITEIREGNPGKYGHRTLIVFLMDGKGDKKEYGVFNENLLRYGLEVGDVIRIGLGKTKNGMLCYVPIEQNGKPVRHTDSKELEIEAIKKEILAQKKVAGLNLSTYSEDYLTYLAEQEYKKRIDKRKVD